MRIIECILLAITCSILFRLLRVWQPNEAQSLKVDFKKFINVHKYLEINRFVIYGFNSIYELKLIKLPFRILSVDPSLVLLVECKDQEELLKHIPSHLNYREYHDS